MLKNSLKEEGGSVSSTRLVMYGTAVVVLGTYVAHNIVALVKGQCGMVDFALNSVIVLGIAMTGKVTQKFAEKKKEAKPQS